MYEDKLTELLEDSVLSIRARLSFQIARDVLSGLHDAVVWKQTSGDQDNPFDSTESSFVFYKIGAALGQEMLRRPSSPTSAADEEFLGRIRIETLDEKPHSWSAVTPRHFVQSINRIVAALNSERSEDAALDVLTGLHSVVVLNHSSHTDDNPHEAYEESFEPHKFGATRAEEILKIQRSQIQQRSDELILAARSKLGQVILKEATFAWNPGTAQVLVVPESDPNDFSRRLHLTYTSGSCWKNWESLKRSGQQIAMLVEALRMIVNDKCPASAVHDAFLVIPEYEALLAKGVYVISV